MNNFNKRLLTIKEAANYLGVTTTTLRRWHNEGTFPASFVSPGGHRYYALTDLEKKIKGLFQLASEWAAATNPTIPEEEQYCSTSDRFRTRLAHMMQAMEAHSSDKNVIALVATAAGEIGNNSFDHNLGNWPDIPGVFFAYDIGKRQIVLADRGVGILTTLRHARAHLKTHEEALHMAFTERVTGRAPEHRGNGLKYAHAALTRANASLRFQSGNATVEIQKENPELIFKQAEQPIRGCLALITYSL